jgi:uncharacterized RDD family membrane protein YckC
MSEVQPPQAPPPPGWRPEGPSGPRASFGTRLVAWLIDWLILVVIVGILYLISKRLGEIGFLLWLAYLTVFEGRAAGQTPGKMAVGIRVIDFRTGGPIGFPHAFLRAICRIISWIPCALGFFWMLWDREKQTWHDKLATTVVVPVAYYPVS